MLTYQSDVDMEKFPQISKRMLRSCTECARRKIKCDHEYPCGACTRRGGAENCKPPESNPQLISDSEQYDADKLALKHRIAVLEARLGDFESKAQSDQSNSNPEGLLVLLESISHVKPYTPTDMSETISIASLYHSGRPGVFLMLLPDRQSSQRIMEFVLANLSWIHCAIRTTVFLQEHESFWNSVENSETIAESYDHGWVSIYFSLLTIGILYMDPQDRPIIPRLNIFEESPGSQSELKIESRGKNIARMWYEAAMKELDVTSPLANANLKTVQAIAILTLAHSHFGQIEQEYLLLGLATNTARVLEMHLLGSEDRFSPRLASQAIWATFENRQLGRRLWWTLVISDWLGMFTRPSSISPASFNTTLFPHLCDIYDLLLPSITPRNESIETANILSPLKYHITMSQLASVIYINVKAPRNPNANRFTTVLDQIERIEASMKGNNPVSKSAPKPAWVMAQEHMIAYTVQLLSVTIARASLVLWLMGRPNTENIIERGLNSALKIVHMREEGVPYLHGRHCIIPSATLAAGVYLAVHCICFKDSSVSTQLTERRRLIRYCIGAIKYPDSNSPLAIQGSQMLEMLLQIEIHSPIPGRSEKAVLVDLLKMACQTEGNSFDFMNEYATLMPTDMDISFDEFGSLWPAVTGDLDLDITSTFPDIDWSQLDTIYHT